MKVWCAHCTLDKQAVHTDNTSVTRSQLGMSKKYAFKISNYSVSNSCFIHLLFPILSPDSDLSVHLQES